MPISRKSFTCLGYVALALVIAAFTAWGYLRRSVEPTPVTTTTLALEQWVEPLPIRFAWGPCGHAKGQEDAALREVLASKNTTDPLFSGSEVRMQAAECAAFRQRVAIR